MESCMCRLLCGACRATGLRNGCRPGARPASSSTHAWMAAETSEELQQRNGAAEPNLLNQAAKFEIFHQFLLQQKNGPSHIYDILLMIGSVVENCSGWSCMLVTED
nr:uncharacterized protein LOC109767538 [Aegilops tauschii subsp. strangulata]